ncbi:MAG TPA: DNA mismatch repair protein MutS, partial [Brevundimonas sp.]|nr:DNA mismatch repair protein MutS [Brevundimonas sp.]
MSRRDDLSPEDRRIWARVAGSVKPSRPRKAVRVIPGAAVADPPPAPLPKKPVKPSGVVPAWT